MSRTMTRADFGQVFRLSRHDLRPNLMLTHRWRTLMRPLPHDPVWSQRVLDYWVRQQVLYGYRAHEGSIRWWYDEAHACIATSAVIAEVLKGRRERDLVLPAADVRSLLQ